MQIFEHKPQTDYNALVMTTIDHRILIPASPHVVWEYISNISRNPKWQVDCESISFLTEKHDGPGTRWRCATAKGHEHVIEITAWYNGLGYEYVYVDGPGYEENRGRLRLQEIPEGTIVQWTFTYTLGGLFGGMRDSLGKRREIDATMADSLRKLYTQLKTQSALSTTPQGESKALIREAPDVEARAHYTPRHPSVMQEQFDPEKTVPTASLSKAGAIVDEPPVADDDGQQLSGIVIPEPLVDEGDTRPNPIVRREQEPSEADQPAEAEVSVGNIPLGEEPDFLSDLDRMEEAEAEPAVQAEIKVEAEVEPEAEAEQSAPASEPEPEPEPEPARDVPPPEIARFMPPVEETRRVEPNAEATLRADVRASAEITPIVSDTAPPVEAVEAPAEPPSTPLPPKEDALAQPVEAETPAEPEAPEPVAPPVEETPAASEPNVPQLEPVDPDATRLIDFPEPEAPAEPEAEAPPEPAREPKPWEEATISTSRLLAEPAKMDTATMSIWEIFGVERPSETQELKAIVAPPKAAPQAGLPTVRMGLRMALRRKLVNVRHP